MPLPKKQNDVGLGRAIINRKVKDARTSRESRNYTTTSDPSALQSITQERDLEEFLNTAQLAGTEFIAEKQNVRIIQPPGVGATSAHNPFLLSAQQERSTLRKHEVNKDRLRVPRRPPWTKTLSPAQLDRQERDSFLEWRRDLAQLSEKENLLLTPFERNIEVWRQLWRVLERSHLVVQIVDARNPLRFRCEDLEKYILDIEGTEGEKGTGKGKRRSLLLLNKADLLTRAQRLAWAEYFQEKGVNFAFYSAIAAAALQGLNNGDQKSVPDTSKEQDEGNEGLGGSPLIPHEESDDSEDGDDSNLELHLAEMYQRTDDDPRIRVLGVAELEELFMAASPPLEEFQDANGNPPSKCAIGLVGYPNVGKSSTINTLIGAKKVSVSSTPGKTKHFQTIELSSKLVLCDCPGLVFPQFATTKADLVCDGVLPIDQMREFRGPIGLVAQRIPRRVVESLYGLTLSKKESGTDHSEDDTYAAEDLLVAYAIARGFARAGQGHPDESRAARYILKDYVNGKILYCHPPPGIDPQSFNQETVERQMFSARAKKKAPLTRVGKNADTSPEVVRSIDSTTNSTPILGSAKASALDREFFDSQGLAAHPFVKGGNKDGQAISRVKLYPHQNFLAQDGTHLGRKHAVAASIIEQAGPGVGSKKHFKPKRAKQRSGKGYD